MRTTNCVLPILLGLLIAPLGGCGETAATTKTGGHDHGHDHDHDHHDRPESLHAAVAELTKMRDTIRDAIVEGDPNDAHDPLHEVGELLEAIPDIAAETDLPKEEWDAVNAANDKLFDAFGAVDKAFHTKDGDKKAAYEAVADKIDEAVEAIRSRLAFTGEEPLGEEGADDHGHDHGDHDHDHDSSDSSDSSDGATP